MLNKCLCIALVGCLCLTFCGCGAASVPETEPPTTQTETTEPSITVEEYKQLISDACDSLYETAIIINNVLTFEDTYWKTSSNIDGSSPSEEKLVEAGMSLLATKSDNEYSQQWLEDAFASDSQRYREIIATDIPEGAEAEKIYDVYEEFFDAYLGLYNLAFAPGGSRSSFESKANEYIGTIKSANTKLEVLVSE